MKEKGVYLYKNLPIIARKGVHESVMELIKKNFKKDAQILVLGSGCGAFEQRLIDNGFNNLTSSDLIVEDYALKEPKIKFIQTDLNKSFSDVFKKKYDLIVAIEVIEHLYSTFNFLSECKKILNEGGKIVFSTQNPHSDSSLLVNYLLFYPNYFVGKPEIYGHINPIFYGILEYLCDLNKLRIVTSYSIKGKGENLSIRRISVLFLKSILLVPIKIYKFFKIVKKDPMFKLKHEIAIYMLGRK